MHQGLKKYLNTNNLLFLYILILGIILRFYRFWDIPFTYDEYYAIFRTHYKNFTDLINFAVKTDGHPALIQVFLFYYTKYVGTSEFIVKFPFLLAGVGSIVLAYVVTRKWFNATTGLFVSSYIAVIQYTVMYSQIARPYISGLFFSLALVNFWTDLVFSYPHKKIRSAAGFIVFASLCCYNHHFSLLFAFIVAVTGLFFLNQQNRKLYILSCLAVVLLYIPHLSIFFAQLRLGGLIWLSKPKADFFIDYLGFLFHFSVSFYALTLLLIILSLIYCEKNKSRFRLISLAWFVFPFVIGFTYSILVKPIIQFSVLIFSFPFLLMFIFSCFQELRNSFKIFIVAIITVTGTLTLTFERKYYDLFYHSFFKESMLQTRNAIDKYGYKNVTVVLNNEKQIFDYINPSIGLNAQDFIRIDSSMNFIKFRKELDTLNTGYLAFSEEQLPYEYSMLIREKYPFIVKKTDYFLGSYTLFSKNSILGRTIEFEFVSKCTFKEPLRPWFNIDTSKLECHSGKQTYFVDSTQEYAPGIKIYLDSIVQNYNDVIEISLKAYLIDTSSTPQVVTAIESDGKNIDWRSMDFKQFVDKKNKWTSVYFAIKLSDIYLKYPRKKFIMYIWNLHKNLFYIDDLKVSTRQGNRYIYSLVEKF